MYIFHIAVLLLHVYGMHYSYMHGCYIIIFALNCCSLFTNLLDLCLSYSEVDETTTDIICIKCKRDDSDAPNEIVLCDTCGIGLSTHVGMWQLDSSNIFIVVNMLISNNQRGLYTPFSCNKVDNRLDHF